VILINSSYEIIVEIDLKLMLKFLQ